MGVVVTWKISWQLPLRRNFDATGPAMRSAQAIFFLSGMQSLTWRRIKRHDGWAGGLSDGERAPIGGYRERWRPRGADHRPINRNMNAPFPASWSPSPARQNAVKPEERHCKLTSISARRASSVTKWVQTLTREAPTLAREIHSTVRMDS